MLEYDAEIIKTFAARLYAKAKWIAVKCTVIAALLGLGAGAGLGAATDVSPLLVAVFSGVLFGYVGYSIGMEKGFRYRLEAQTALCQVKIEENTGKGA